MTEIHKNTDAITDYFDNLEDYKIQEFYNSFAEQNSWEQVYTNDDEFITMNYPNSIDLITALEFGDYRRRDNFVQFNEYGNLETTNNIFDFVDLDELMKDAEENPERYEIEFIDPNDLDDEELFNYLNEQRCFECVPNTDKYSEIWTREKLEEIGIDFNVI